VIAVRGIYHERKSLAKTNDGIGTAAVRIEAPDFCASRTAGGRRSFALFSNACTDHLMHKKYDFPFFLLPFFTYSASVILYKTSQNECFAHLMT